MKWGLVAVLLAFGAGAHAKDEPFGQETVEVRPWRNPPRPGSRPAHSHKHGHRHRDGEGGHKHAHAHSHAHRPGHADGHRHGSSEPQGHDHKNGHHHHGIETEHLFGFTTGTDIDPAGAKHLIADLDGRFAKQGGSYAALSQRFEYAFTPWQDFHVGLSASFAAHSISGVEGLDDRRSAAFEGFGIELRQRLLDRAQAPFGLAIVAEPHWARLDEVSGDPATKFAIEFTVAADRELIKDKLFGAMNLIYEPEWVRVTATGQTERESTLGVSLAAMTQVMPSVFLGGELRYLRKYEGAALNSFAGEAVFLGPALFINVNDRLAVAAALSTQIAGRPAGGSAALDLENFERHRAKLKAIVNF